MQFIALHCTDLINDEVRKIEKCYIEERLPSRWLRHINRSSVLLRSRPDTLPDKLIAQV